MDLGEGVEDEAEEAMLAAALAASVGEKGQVWWFGVSTCLLYTVVVGAHSTLPTRTTQTQGAGAEGEDEDAALARALAASAASWRCGACTFENVGGGVKVRKKCGYGVWLGLGGLELVVFGFDVRSPIYD